MSMMYLDGNKDDIRFSALIDMQGEFMYDEQHDVYGTTGYYCVSAKPIESEQDWDGYSVIVFKDNGGNLEFVDAAIIPEGTAVEELDTVANDMFKEIASALPDKNLSQKKAIDKSYEDI